MSLLLYGPNHPLSFVSGGFPDSIWEMKPEHIRKFHRDHYHLNNMGAVMVIPKNLGFKEFLTQLGNILTRVEGSPPQNHYLSESEIPPPTSGPEGAVRIVEYPERNDQQPVPTLMAWKPQLALGPQDRRLLELFMKNIAGDANTNLSRLLINRQSRILDSGATSVFGNVSSDRGNVVSIGLVGVSPSFITEENLRKLREVVTQELKRIGSWPDGSRELVEFNRRAQNLLRQSRRHDSRLINSPPQFGQRHGNSALLWHLDDVQTTSGFKKSLSFKHEVIAIKKLLESSHNIWRDHLPQWKLVNSRPFVVAPLPSAEFLNKEEVARQERIKAELSFLQTKYAVKTPQEALSHYQQDYDAATATLDSKASSTSLGRFVDRPPIGLDEHLRFKAETLSRGVPLVATAFQTMRAGRAGLAFRVSDIPKDEQVYLALLPDLVARVGVVVVGKPIAYEQMREAIQREIQGVFATFRSAWKEGHSEIVVAGAGGDENETLRAVEWTKRVLRNPYWSTENLPRIRDVIDQTVNGLRSTVQQSEESWVENPSLAYWRQDNPVMLTTSSFLTRLHHAHRLRWLFKDAKTEEARQQFASWIGDLGSARKESRHDLKAFLGLLRGRPETKTTTPALAPFFSRFEKLTPGAKDLVADAAKDLEQALGDVPDVTLPNDWRYLCRQIQLDVQVGPENALRALSQLHHRIFTVRSARAFITASPAAQEPLRKALDRVVAILPAGLDESTRGHEPNTGLTITKRLQQHSTGDPQYVGLVLPTMQRGVFANTAPVATYFDTESDKLLDLLASLTHAGNAGHSIYSRILSAGMAYSNGIRVSITNGRMMFYAERVPDLRQTMQYIVHDLKTHPTQLDLLEYSFARTFQGNRGGLDYEARGESMAADIADGITPERVRLFYHSLLALRSLPELEKKLRERSERLFGKILPGYTAGTNTDKEVELFVIGSERQIESYDAYLKSVISNGSQVKRLYPRDFWLTLPAAEPSEDV